MVSANEALRHWAVWSRQYGFSASTCCSIEKRFANDPDRYQWVEDKERILEFKPNHNIALKAEKLMIKTLRKDELRALVACEVYGHRFPLDRVAKALKINTDSLKTYRLAGRNKFKGVWNG